jgi:hypothetical protein
MLIATNVHPAAYHPDLGRHRYVSTLAVAPDAVDLRILTSTDKSPRSIDNNIARYKKSIWLHHLLRVATYIRYRRMVHEQVI